MERPGLVVGDIDALRSTIAAHRFCGGLDVAHVSALADNASEVHLSAGTFAIRRGRPADALYLLTAGDVAIELHDPIAGPLTLETLHAGDPLGWSWLYEPRTWSFDAMCLTDVTSIRIDAAGLRELIDTDTAFGREIALRMGAVVADRLLHARIALVDVHHHDR